ncbi:hypothetical protein [Campylobacter sp. MG1]|uniref:hypothetical protein n=1 Tax=Campylobacter sp. MG1 TaxID=2976332 RepID=UPI00226CB666|nr:hypothetical protein [Campylobacter sp. MG1]
MKINDFFNDLECKYQVSKLELLILLQFLIKKELGLKYDVYLELEDDKCYLYENHIDNFEREFRLTKKIINNIKQKLEQEVNNNHLNNEIKDLRYKYLKKVIKGEIIDSYKYGYIVKTPIAMAILPFNQLSKQDQHSIEFFKEKYFFITKINKIDNFRNEFVLDTKNQTKIIIYILKQNLKQFFIKINNNTITIFTKKPVDSRVKSKIISSIGKGYKIYFKDNDANKRAK